MATTNPNPVAPKTDTPATQELHFAYDEEDMEALKLECLDMFQAGNHACKWTPDEAFEQAQKHHSSLIEWLFDGLRSNRSTLAAERASRLQAEDQAFNAGIVEAAKAARDWDCDKHDDAVDAIMAKAKPCTSQTHIWRSGECMVCDLSKPSVSPEQEKP